LILACIVCSYTAGAGLVSEGSLFLRKAARRRARAIRPVGLEATSIADNFYITRSALFESNSAVVPRSGMGSSNSPKLNSNSEPDSAYFPDKPRLRTSFDWSKLCKLLKLLVEVKAVPPCC